MPERSNTEVMADTGHAASRQRPSRKHIEVVVTYDAHLVDRVRELLADRSAMTERKMFGGLAFLVAGKVAVAARGQGGLLVRVDPARAEHLLATTYARPMEMKGRAVRGWLLIDGDDLCTKRQLAKLIAIGTSTAMSVPTKS